MDMDRFDKVNEMMNMMYSLRKIEVKSEVLNESQSEIDLKMENMAKYALESWILMTNGVMKRFKNNELMRNYVWDLLRFDDIYAKFDCECNNSTKNITYIMADALWEKMVDGCLDKR